LRTFLINHSTKSSGDEERRTCQDVRCLNPKRHHISVDERALSKRLGIPVIPASARSGEGIPELIQTINQVAVGEIKCKPHRIKITSKQVNEAIEELSQKLKAKYPDLPNTRWIAMRLLDGDKHIIDALKNGEFLIAS